MPYVGRDAASFTTVVDVTVSDDLTVTDDATIGGALSAKGGAVFNEDSADVDFRVESNGNANMLFVDAGNDAVGVGTGSPNDYYSTELVVAAADEGGISIVNSTTHMGHLAFADGTSGTARYSGYVGYDHNVNTMALGTSGNHRMSISSGGDIDVETGDIFFSTAGKGIVLGATSNTAANTLDDYEEGTITLTMGGGNDNPNATQQLSGQYTKVGNLVTFNAMNESINNTGAVGSIYFTGLPFATTGAYGVGSCATSHVASFTGNISVQLGGTTCYVQQSISEAVIINVNHHVDTGGKFYLFGSYQTAA
jgi:hypothetical protein